MTAVPFNADDWNLIINNNKMIFVNLKHNIRMTQSEINQSSYDLNKIYDSIFNVDKTVWSIHIIDGKTKYKNDDERITDISGNNTFVIIDDGEYGPDYYKISSLNDVNIVFNKIYITDFIKNLCKQLANVNKTTWSIIWHNNKIHYKNYDKRITTDADNGLFTKESLLNAIFENNKESFQIFVKQLNQQLTKDNSWTIYFYENEPYYTNNFVINKDDERGLTKDMLKEMYLNNIELLEELINNIVDNTNWYIIFYNDMIYYKNYKIINKDVEEGLEQNLLKKIYFKDIELDKLINKITDKLINLPIKEWSIIISNGNFYYINQYIQNRDHANGGINTKELKQIMSEKQAIELLHNIKLELLSKEWNLQNKNYVINHKDLFDKSQFKCTNGCKYIDIQNFFGEDGASIIFNNIMSKRWSLTIDNSHILNDPISDGTILLDENDGKVFYFTPGKTYSTEDTTEKELLINTLNNPQTWIFNKKNNKYYHDDSMVIRYATNKKYMNDLTEDQLYYIFGPEIAELIINISKMNELINNLFKIYIDKILRDNEYEKNYYYSKLYNDTYTMIFKLYELSTKF